MNDNNQYSTPQAWLRLYTSIIHTNFDNFLNSTIFKILKKLAVNVKIPIGLNH